MSGLDCSKTHQLENHRVRLVPLTLDHMEPLSEIAYTQKELTRYSASLRHDPDLLRAYIEGALAERAAGTRYPFCIFDKQTGRFAGSSSYGNITNAHKRLEIGWTWIGKEFQRTGLNRNCKFLLLSYAFETLGCERVELKTDSRNQQSRTAITGIGAKEEGMLRRHMLMPDGAWRDTVYYSILLSEWPEIKARVFKGFE